MEYLILSGSLASLRSQIKTLALDGWLLMGPVTFASERREGEYVATMLLHPNTQASEDS